MKNGNSASFHTGQKEKRLEEGLVRGCPAETKAEAEDVTDNFAAETLLGNENLLGGQEQGEISFALEEIAHLSEEKSSNLSQSSKRDVLFATPPVSQTVARRSALLLSAFQLPFP
jgi:hypothetical protein